MKNNCNNYIKQVNMSAIEYTMDGSDKMKVASEVATSSGHAGLPDFLIETILKQLPSTKREISEEDSKAHHDKNHFPRHRARLDASSHHPTEQATHVILPSDDFNIVGLQNFTHRFYQWRQFLQASFAYNIPIMKTYEQDSLVNPAYHDSHTHARYHKHNEEMSRFRQMYNPIQSVTSYHHTNSSDSNRDESAFENSPLSKLNELSEKINSEPEAKKRKLSSSDEVRRSDVEATNRVDEQLDKHDIEEGSQPASDKKLWPAWVYCTRYSDRPSAGPRIRRMKNKTKIHEKSRESEKRARTAFSSIQLDQLQKEFEESQYLTEERRVRLSGSLGLTVAQIKVWFQNKRAKVKKTSGVRNTLAMELIAQGLYNHCTQGIKENVD